MNASPSQIWDVFCKVVDNFGDIGVCWRLAKQLSSEHEIHVRLWVDDLHTFKRIHPSIDTEASSQNNLGVDIRHWSDNFPNIEPGDVVVETFGCEVPDSFQNTMVEKNVKPIWINLDYLSAESWVEGCHTLPSPHPRLPITKYFFFPGFTSQTGGLLRERDLLDKQKTFLEDPSAIASFWSNLGLGMPTENEVRLSMFCYENPAAQDLIETWKLSNTQLTCFVFEGVAAEQLQSFYPALKANGKKEFSINNLTVKVLPFFNQIGYDHLLWACDYNFVRGEDSFVRAQYAGKPFIWHIYPQTENAHWIKLNAFIDQYAKNLEPNALIALRNFWRAWNSGRGAGAAWENFWEQRTILQNHAKKWLDHLKSHDDLAFNLVRFARNLLK